MRELARARTIHGEMQTAELLCAVDATPRAFETVAVASDLARRLDLTLALVHVVQDPPGHPRHELGTRHLRELTETMDLRPDTRLLVESGDPAESLQTLAADLDAHLVVVGSRGRGRIRSALLGSVSRDLAERLDCPLVLVPPGAAHHYSAAEASENRTVVCGIDNALAADAAVAFADHLAGCLHARLHVAYVGNTLTHVPVGYTGSPFPTTRVLAQHEQARERIARAAQHVEEAGEIEFTFHVGDSTQSLKLRAEEGAVQMIVVPHELSWQRLAAAAGPPVAVVPSRLPRPSRTA